MEKFHIKLKEHLGRLKKMENNTQRLCLKKFNSSKIPIIKLKIRKTKLIFKVKPINCE